MVSWRDGYTRLKVIISFIDLSRLAAGEASYGESDFANFELVFLNFYFLFEFIFGS